jgi:hypothetical protein
MSSIATAVKGFFVGIAVTLGLASAPQVSVLVPPPPVVVVQPTNTPDISSAVQEEAPKKSENKGVQAITLNPPPVAVVTLPPPTILFSPPPSTKPNLVIPPPLPVYIPPSPTHVSPPPAPTPPTPIPNPVPPPQPAPIPPPPPPEQPKDEYALSVQADKTSVPVTYGVVNFKVSALKNGQVQSQQSISVSTPDASQNTTLTNGAGYTYIPKTAGTHTITFSWHGVSKNIDITASQNATVNPDVINVVDLNPTIPLAHSGVAIGRFSFKQADEPIQLNAITADTTGNPTQIIYSTGVSQVGSAWYENGTHATASINNVPAGEVTVRVTPSQAGSYTVTITEVKVLGQQSGLYRDVGGLPIIFHYTVE